MNGQRTCAYREIQGGDHGGGVSTVHATSHQRRDNQPRRVEATIIQTRQRVVS